MMECGAHIKRLRETMGMTQRKLAQEMNVSPAAVAYWETGRSMPSTENLLSLADIFGCSLDALFGRDGPERTPA